MMLMWEGEVKNLCRSVPRKYPKQEQIHASSAKTRSMEYFERSISKFPKDCHMLSQIEHPMNSVRSERGGKEYEWLRQGQLLYMLYVVNNTVVAYRKKKHWFSHNCEKLLDKICTTSIYLCVFT